MRHTIRTLLLLQHDDDRVEDLDTDQEDHAADAVRYACMTRPMVMMIPSRKINAGLIRMYEWFTNRLHDFKRE